MATIPAEHLAWARDWIAGNTWTFAKTYAKTAPHEYVVQEKLPPELRSGFERFAELIVACGHTEDFYRTVRPYLVIDGWKYWRIENIINRDNSGQLYGDQVSSRTESDREATVYDFAAARWDAQVPPRHRDDELSRAKALLTPLIGRGRRALVVGCGTGVLLDVMGADVNRFEYLGCDPSSGMLNMHVLKHPKHRVACLTLAEYAEHPKAHSWDSVIVCFGAADHLSTEEVQACHELADDGLVLIFHGEVPSIAPKRSEALEAALTLPLAQQRPLGRWNAVTVDLP